MARSQTFPANPEPNWRTLAHRCGNYAAKSRRCVSATHCEIRFLLHPAGRANLHHTAGVMEAAELNSENGSLFPISHRLAPVSKSRQWSACEKDAHHTGHVFKVADYCYKNGHTHLPIAKKTQKIYFRIRPINTYEPRKELAYVLLTKKSIKVRSIFAVSFLAAHRLQGARTCQNVISKLRYNVRT